MSYNGGYQSSISIDTIRQAGGLPVDLCTGGFNVTDSVNDYTLQLFPPFQNLNSGILLEVMIGTTNTSACTLDVNGEGPIPIMKPAANGVEELTAGDLKQNMVYLMVFTGDYFQLMNDGFNPKSMRTQLRFHSASLPENRINNTPADVQQGQVVVRNLPDNAVIRTTSLTWTGVIINQSSANTKLNGGNLAIINPRTGLITHLQLANKLSLDPGQAVRVSFCAENVEESIDGNGAYTVKMMGASATSDHLTLYGHWTAEVDYEII